MNMADRIIYWFTDNILGWFMVCILVSIPLLLGLCIYGYYIDSKKETFSLIKEDWVCAQERTQLIPITTMVGKVPIITMTTTRTCIQYNMVLK